MVGCYEAIYFGEHSKLNISFVDNVDISRRGCLAEEVNALNA